MLTLQRGDTIIEALLAFTVFSLVSVGAMTVMNQATNASQRSLEITLVRQQVDAQAEALRAAQQAFWRAGNPSSTEWSKIALSGSTNNSVVFTSDSDCPTRSTLNSNRVFIMNPTDATLVTGASWYNNIDTANPLPYARVSGANSYGIWIERAYKASGAANAPSSYDFTVRACWFGAGMNRPMQIKTSVRLYEPR